MHVLRLSFLRLLFIPLLSIPVPPARAAAPAAATGDITVAVSAVRNPNGEIVCALFDTAASFEKRIPLLRVVARPQSPATTCVFRNVKAGAYAITAFHDENGNGRLDTTFYGRPTEGYGVSNDHTYAMHGPRFAESEFRFSGSGELAIVIHLHYP